MRSIHHRSQVGRNYDIKGNKNKNKIYYNTTHFVCCVENGWEGNMCSNIEYRDEKEIGEPVWADFPPILCLFLANWMYILYIWADLLAVLNHQSHLCWISTFVLFCIFDNALTKCMCFSKIQLTVMETTMMMILVLKTMMMMVMVA